MVIFILKKYRISRFSFSTEL